MRFVETDTARYAIEIHQRSENLPRILLLHGFMGDRRIWDPMIERFCSFSNPITLDLLGHGDTSKPTEAEPYREKHQLADLLHIIQSLELSPLLLLGYSMGGRLALKTALRNPSLFSGLILESTNCGITDEAKREERKSTDHSRAAAIEDNFQKFLENWQKLDLFQSPLPQDEQRVKRYNSIQSQQSAEAVAASLRGFGTGFMQAVCRDVAELELPVLLLAGSDDKKYQQICAFLEDKLPNAIFASVRGGHRVHLDNPKSYLEEIHKFIDRLWTGKQ